MDEDVFTEFETSEEQIFGHEFSVRERCQQIGISMENARYRVGSDRFKWLALMAMLELRRENEMFDDVSIDTFFDSVLPKITDVQHKNPLACILAFYIGMTDELHFILDMNKLLYIQNNVYPSQENLFQLHGLKLPDLVRYIRYFKETFPK